LLKIDAWTMKNGRFRRCQTLVCAAGWVLVSAQLGARDLSTFVNNRLWNAESTPLTCNDPRPAAR
jgi:hypothetical protein